MQLFDQTVTHALTTTLIASIFLFIYQLIYSSLIYHLSFFRPSFSIQTIKLEDNDSDSAIDLATLDDLYPWASQELQNMFVDYKIIRIYHRFKNLNLYQNALEKLNLTLTLDINAIFICLLRAYLDNPSVCKSSSPFDILFDQRLKALTTTLIAPNIFLFIYKLIHSF